MTKAPLHVHVLYESTTGDMPHGCSYIRLLRPLTHPSVVAGIRLTSSLELQEPYPDIVIIERLWDHLCSIPALFTLLGRLRQLRIPLLFEIDDDLLSVGTRPGERNWPTVEQRMWLRALVRNADGVLVSTPNLGNRLKRLNHAIEVIPNSLDERLFSMAQSHSPRRGEEKQITFGYMGTFTHLEDLISIIGPLRSVLARHADRLTFEIVGVGDAPLLQEAFQGLPVRFREVPAEAVPYEQFTAWMQQNLRWDFGVAPLCSSVFTSSKSDIKFLDYAVLGIPGIFADLPAYAGTVRHLQNGLLASSVEEWEAALEQMSLDSELRSRLALAAHAEVWESRMLQTCACQWQLAVEMLYTKARTVPMLWHEVAPSGQTLLSPLSREQKLLMGCDMAGTGLEIGASYCPVAPKREGYRVEVLDHASAEILREKYRDLSVDISNIEDVDYIWSGEPLHELTGKTDYYDWIVASHVVEHTPDLIAFLQQCETMLKPEGILCLAIPDHRYCFDIFRPLSTPGSVIQAFLEKRNRHTLASIWDHFSMTTRKGDHVAWYNGHPGDYQPMHRFNEVNIMFQRAQTTSDYIDVHNWIFTPASFFLIMLDIGALGYTGLQVCNSFPVDGCEFIVQLKKVGSGALEQSDPDQRRQLLIAMLE